MNPAEREQLRLSLLRYLERDGSAVFGLPTQRLVVLVRSEGYQVTHHEVEHELNYLADPEKAMIATIPKVLSSGSSWKLTARGRDYLESLQTADSQ
jgi:hypothetical protein